MTPAFNSKEDYLAGKPGIYRYSDVAGQDWPVQHQQGETMSQAFLSAINPKETKAGTMYDLVFSDGNKVGAGKFPPKGLTVGEYYKYEFTANGNFKNLTPGSVAQLPKPAGVTPSAPPTVATGAKSGGSFDDRQVIISKQAALNSALAFVSTLVTADALPIAKKDMTTAKAADAMLGVVDHYTDLFYKQATGDTFPRAEDSKPPFNEMGAAESKDESWSE